ncbi:MAG: glycosyltransferase N-terminal domain-containing protein, partial [Pseudomonadota bacterium]|nr:glycosyltransferase N-terminal domain-containing protein [Pseudomonadota bacterium]
MARLLTLLSVLLAPLLVLGLRLRGEPAARTAERLARRSPAKMERAENTKATDAPAVLWFHGASVGEVRALLPLVLHYANRAEAGEGVLVTVQSAQGYAVATQALEACPQVAVAMAPMDHPGVMARFCRLYRPRGLVLY